MKYPFDDSPLRDLLEQQERLRDVFDPPELRRIREQQEVFRDAFDHPELRRLREQRERLRDLSTTPALRSLHEDQERLSRLFDPPTVDSLRQEYQKIQDIVGSSSLQGTFESARGALDQATLQKMSLPQSPFREMASYLDTPGLRDSLQSFSEQANTFTATMTDLTKQGDITIEPWRELVDQISRASIDLDIGGLARASLEWKEFITGPAGSTFHELFGGRIVDLARQSRCTVRRSRIYRS